MHEQNSFLTLTYDQLHVPADYGLRKEAFPLFMKRLRKAVSPQRVRYFHCGEYGEETRRPHYHAVLFGLDFSFDRVPWTERNGHTLYRSESLEDIWKLGQVLIGEVTFESAAYVARYVVKKVTGSGADAAYERVDGDTGECYQVEPEFATMSRSPGIGMTWIQKYLADVYPWDEVISNGHPSKPPRAYDRYLESVDPVLSKKVRKARTKERRYEDETQKRLRVREMCTQAGLSLKGDRSCV